MNSTVLPTPFRVKQIVANNAFVLQKLRSAYLVGGTPSPFLNIPIVDGLRIPAERFDASNYQIAFMICYAAQGILHMIIHSALYEIKKYPAGCHRNCDSLPGKNIYYVSTKGKAPTPPNSFISATVPSGAFFVTAFDALPFLSDSKRLIIAIKDGGLCVKS